MCFNSNKRVQTNLHLVEAQEVYNYNHSANLLVPSQSFTRDWPSVYNVDNYSDSNEPFIIFQMQDQQAVTSSHKNTLSRSTCVNNFTPYKANKLEILARYTSWCECNAS